MSVGAAEQVRGHRQRQFAPQRVHPRRGMQAILGDHRRVLALGAADVGDIDEGHVVLGADHLGGRVELVGLDLDRGQVTAAASAERAGPRTGHGTRPAGARGTGC
ncbi:hypothetical protein G6F22_017976 [Rhizopus arrhizus]|nr:hypothetical protein G6F22_017976 [Rhizopus arrhizus]